MIYKNIKLNELHPLLKDSDATLTIFLHDQDKEYNNCEYKRPGILIIPGGGYEFVSTREKEPVAFKFLSEGFNCFCLTYSCYKHYPTPHLEAAVAMNYINSHKKEFFLFDNNVFMVGFSAGGHLVGSYAYLYPDLAKMLSLEKESLRPSGLILSYAVLTMGVETHGGTRNVITNNDERLIELLSVEKHITSNYPPTFIWATSTDMIVPPINTYMLIDEFKKYGVKYESVIYPFGEHGLSICRNSTTMNYNSLNENEELASSWVSKAVKFFLDLLK